VLLNVDTAAAAAAAAAAYAGDALGPPLNLGGYALEGQRSQLTELNPHCTSPRAELSRCVAGCRPYASLYLLGCMHLLMIMLPPQHLSICS
jgi:hypothetical protein